jgi:hypothetical protein
MRIAATLTAFPVFPETKGKERNPKEVTDIERAHSKRPARLVAAEAVVIAESNPPRPEMVNTINDEHGEFSSQQPESATELYGQTL